MRGVLLGGLLLVAVAAANDLENISVLEEVVHIPFDELQQRIQNEDPIQFYEGVKLRFSDESPTLEDLTSMANSLVDGVVPEYITNHGYSLVANFTGTYNQSDSNQGSFNTLSYGLVQSVGNEGVTSVINFNFFQGSYGTLKYTAGTSLFSQGSYTKNSNSLAWEGAIKGVYLFKTPNSGYIAYGNHTGAGEGTSVAADGSVTGSARTLFVMNTPQYFSKTTLISNDVSDEEGYNGAFSMYSLTGGTNGTFTNIGTFSSTGNRIRSAMNGALHNSVRQATTAAEIEGYVNFDRTDPFSDVNLPNYFAALAFGVGIYLP